MKRPNELVRAKIKFLATTVVLNVLIVATFLTSSPTESPASTWITAVDKVLYKTGLKSSNLKALHMNSASLGKEDCMACHGNMETSRVPLHKMHLTSELLPGLQCHNCHNKIELGGQSNVKVVELVNVGFCKKCHSRWSGLNPNSAMKPADAKADCKMCHAGRHAFRHAEPYLSQVIASRECYGCHGGRELPWVPQHEAESWVQEHGMIALGKEERCMKCHEYGLDFCKACHSKRPPSHQPIDNWRTLHKGQAKEDTRICFTCHNPLKFCKKCHVGHTPDWQKVHFTVVLKEGTATCTRCHSAVFCEGCHTKRARESATKK
ncbi:MAG: hypothetical protein ACYC1U_08490 [Candidatus Aquicultorales bacterium]